MYYDLLARLKNGFRAKKETIHAPFSNFDFAVAKFLENAGYVSGVEKRAIGKRSVLELRLKYDTSGHPHFTDFRLLSKPSRRLYIGYHDIKQVRQGNGYAAISTPEGVMSNREARKKKLGGELLFEIW